MNYDKLLLKIGEFGWWQKKAIMLLMIPAFVGGMLVMTTAFTTKVPDKFVCHNIKCDELLTSAVDQTLLNRHADDGDDEGPDSCIMVPLKKFENNTCGNDDNPDPKEIYCDSKSDYKVIVDFAMKSSVVTDNNALCMDGANVYKTICDSFFMVGYFVGGMLFGMIADAFGRKISVTLAIFFSFIGSGIGPLVHNHWAYAVTRIIPGAGSIACYLMAFTLAVEVIGKKEQVYGVPWNMTIFSFVGNIIAIPFALGEASNGLIAFLFPQWDSFQFCVTFICGIAGIIWFFIPESPRWLIGKGRFDTATQLILVAAESNGKELTEEDLKVEHKAENVTEVSRTSSVSSIVMALKEEAEEVIEGIFHPILLKSTIVLFIIWTVISLIYYGTSFGIEELHLTENPYLAVGFVALVEIPAYIVTALIMDVTGRKPLLIFTLLVTAVSCLVSAVATEHSTLATAMILIAKFNISSTFTVSRIYTSELYPTNMRATALGTCKSVSCIGAIASPWIGNYLPRKLPKLGRPISLIIYAVCSAVAGILSFQLADTVGFPLPDNLEDVQQIKIFQKPMFKLAGPGWDPTKAAAGDDEEKSSQEEEV